jgi:predicted ester cyclase
MHRTRPFPRSGIPFDLIAAVLAATLAGCATDTAATETEYNKQQVLRVYEEAYNGGDTSVVDELLAPDYVNHQVFPGLPDDREGIKQVIGSMRTAFPDLDIEIHDIVAEDDMVYVRATIHGTHLGPLSGMEPSGRQVAFDTIDTFRLADGVQVEHWGVTDQLGLMYQIGALGQ